MEDRKVVLLAQNLQDTAACLWLTTEILQRLFPTEEAIPCSKTSPLGTILWAQLNINRAIVAKIRSENGTN